MMRIAFFGMDGPVSARCVEAVARHHYLVALVRWNPPGGRNAFGIRRFVGDSMRRFGLRGVDHFAVAAQAAGIGVHNAGRAHDAELARLLAQARPDLLCVAGYPRLLSARVLSTARLGGVNVHTALLPRHRGPLPLFWIYHADDRKTGVTVHWMTERADDGDIILQSSFALRRGEPVDELNRRNAEVAGPLLRSALAEIEAGTASRTVQDPSQATAAPLVDAGTAMVSFAQWDVERVWHFCSGLFPRFIEPLHDQQGRPVRYRGVMGYTRTPTANPPGSVARAARGYDLFCRGGCVHLVA